MNALAGNDTITNAYSKVTIYAGSGNDKINNSGASLVAYGDIGDDSIYNSARYVTISGGSDNDTVYNYDGDNSSIVGGDGTDSIYAYDNDYVTISGGAGADTVSGYYYGSKILGDSGNDSLIISGGYNTVDGGYNNDTISAYGGSISGGAGNDKITVTGEATINGGADDDTINGSTSYKNYFQYAYGDGNDLIYNYKNGDVVSIKGLSQYTTLTSGNNKIVSVIGSGAMTLNGAASKTLSVMGGTYKSNNPAVSIVSSKNNTTLNGTPYNDTIKNIYDYGGDTVLINAGAGADSIYNDWGYNVTIDAGDGNDTITIYRGSSNSIDGGAGADVISLSSSKGVNAIKGGTGNDIIYGDNVAHLYKYAKGDGNDIIYGHNNSDSIEITNGAYMTTKSGQNVIINITSGANSTVSTGAITLSGAAGHTLNIIGTKVNTTPTIPPDTVSSVTQKQVIQKFMGVLDTVTSSDGLSRLNQAVSIASGGYFTNINSAINQMVLDCQDAGASNFLTNYCGINLTNADTGAITGKDAGGSTVKDKNSIVPENTNLNYSNFTDNSFTVNGLTVKLSSFDYYTNPSSISYSSLTSNTQRYIWQAFKTWWVGGALNLISESYGSNFSYTNSNASNHTLYFGFEYENSGTMATTYRWGSQKIWQTAMTINMHNYNTLITGNPNGKLSNDDSFYLDRVLSHEFTHAVMGVNIDYFGSLPKFIKEGMAELTHGVDDDREDEITALANNPTRLRNALNLESQSYDCYAGGYMFLRYLAKQGVLHGNYSGNPSSSNMSALVAGSNNSSGNVTTAPKCVSIKSGVLTANSSFDEDMIDLTMYPSTVTKVNATALTNGVLIIGNTKNNSISAGKGSDTVSGNSGNDTILGGNGNDLLMGDAGNDVIKGDAGADTLFGGYGNDTMTGGAGNDIFVHISGNDIIEDYTAGQDKIKINEGGILSSSISGSNVILKTLNGSINVKNAKGKNITVIDKDGNETTQIYSTSSNSASSKTSTSGTTGISVSGAVLTATAAFTGDEINLANYDSTVTKVNATAVNQALSIVGTAAANSLKGGKGNDTLSGGNGNDTLTGGNGADVFVYSGGNDIITDYTVGQDKIKISGASITSASISGNHVVLKTSKGNITVQNTKGKNITVIDKDGKESTEIYPRSSGSTVPSSTIPAGISTSGAVLTAAKTFAGNKIDLSDYPSTVTKVNATALTKAVSIVGSSANNSIKGGSGADSISGGSGNDTLTGGNGNDIFIYSSGNDTITDYTAGQDKIKLSGVEITSSSLNGNNVILKTSKGNITVQNGKGKNITVIDKNGKSTTNVYPLSTLPVGISVNGATLTAAKTFTGNTIKIADYSGVTKVTASAVTKALTITGDSKANSIVGGSGADIINGDAGKDTISGGSGNDKLYGGADNDVLKGDAGNDSLYAGTGNDTLTGGAGNDWFFYEGGNDVITDYTSGQDKIKFSVAISSSSVSGNNVILKTAKGNVTVQNGKGKKITVIDLSGKETSKIYSTGSTSTTVPAATLPAGISINGATLTAAKTFTGNTIKIADYSGVTKVTASAVTKALTITGNSAANSIVGGSGADVINGDAGKDTISGGSGNDKIYGGDGNDVLRGDTGNDSLFAGTGNDTLTGGTGNDWFFYEGGNDVITDYTAGQDKIKLSGVAISSSSVSGNNVILKTAKGNITIQNGKGKNITIIDKNGNSSTKKYTASGSSRVAENLWFIDDDNFISNDMQLDSISEVTADKYSSGNIETYNYNNLDTLQIASNSQDSLNNN